MDNLEHFANKYITYNTYGIKKLGYIYQSPKNHRYYLFTNDVNFNGKNPLDGFYDKREFKYSWRISDQSLHRHNITIYGDNTIIANKTLLTKSKFLTINQNE